MYTIATGIKLKIDKNEIRHVAVRGNETVIWRIPGVVHDMTEGENEGDITLAKCRYLLLNGRRPIET